MTSGLRSMGLHMTPNAKLALAGGLPAACLAYQAHYMLLARDRVH